MRPGGMAAVLANHRRPYKSASIGLRFVVATYVTTQSDQIVHEIQESWNARSVTISDSSHDRRNQDRTVSNQGLTPIANTGSDQIRSEEDSGELDPDRILHALCEGADSITDFTNHQLELQAKDAAIQKITNRLNSKDIDLVDVYKEHLEQQINGKAEIHKVLSSNILELGKSLEILAIVRK